MAYVYGMLKASHFCCMKQNTKTRELMPSRVMGIAVEAGNWYMSFKMPETRRPSQAGIWPRLSHHADKPSAWSRVWGWMLLSLRCLRINDCLCSFPEREVFIHHFKGFFFLHRNHSDANFLGREDGHSHLLVYQQLQKNMNIHVKENLITA